MTSSIDVQRAPRPVAMDWCILRTSAGRTLTLARALTQAEFEVWTPAEEREQRVGASRARQDLMKPIVPGLVFARATRLSELAGLSRSPSLTYRVWDGTARRFVIHGYPTFTVFRDADRFALVTDASLAPLRAIEAKLAVVAERRHRAALERGPAPRFAAGDVVRVADGSFEGLDLTVLEPNDGKLVSVGVAGCTWAMTISAWNLNGVQLQQAMPDVA